MTGDHHRRLFDAVAAPAPRIRRGRVVATFPEAVADAARHVPEAAPSGHPVYRLSTVPNERVSCELH